MLRGQPPRHHDTTKRPNANGRARFSGLASSLSPLASSECHCLAVGARWIARAERRGSPTNKQCGDWSRSGVGIDHCSRADRKDSCPPGPRARREHYLPVLDSFYPAGITAFSPGVASLRATLGCGEAEPSTLQGLDPRGLTCGVDSASSALEMPATLSGLARIIGIRIPRVVAARQPLG